MKRKYEVQISTVAVITLTVEAESKEDAEREALDNAWDFPNDAWELDSESFEVDNVKLSDKTDDEDTDEDDEWGEE